MHNEGIFFLQPMPIAQGLLVLFLWDGFKNCASADRKGGAIRPSLGLGHLRDPPIQHKWHAAGRHARSSPCRFIARPTNKINQRRSSRPSSNAPRQNASGTARESMSIASSAR